ncbi:MAG: hypothetical protein M5U19_17980 [Microthrixaceae bacterium]|nr:hypothetical protein [Microthrixaceae bacterium]
MLGLIISSVIVDNFTWPWVFAMPAGMAAIALVITAVVVPHSREHQQGRFDVVGSLLAAVAVGGLVLGIQEGPESGWTEPLTVIGLVIGVASVLGFVVWELRHENPLLAVRVFRNRTLTAGSVNLLVVFAVMGGLFLVLVQFLQAALGYSAIKASLSLLPMALIMMPLSAVAPTIAGRVRFRRMFVTGTLLVAGRARPHGSDGQCRGRLHVGRARARGVVDRHRTRDDPRHDRHHRLPARGGTGGCLGAQRRGHAGQHDDRRRPDRQHPQRRLLVSGCPDRRRAAAEAAEAVRSGIGGAVVASRQMGAAGEGVLAGAATPSSTGGHARCG